MTDHPITPPPELVQKWMDAPHGLGLGCHPARSVPNETYAKRLVEAAQWGADQQLAQDAKWLDQNALNEPHLRITPVGESLKEAMRPKPPSLKEQALETLRRLSVDKYPCNYQEDSDWDTILRALEELPE